MAGPKFDEKAMVRSGLWLSASVMMVAVILSLWIFFHDRGVSTALWALVAEPFWVIVGAVVGFFSCVAVIGVKKRSIRVLVPPYGDLDMLLCIVTIPVCMLISGIAAAYYLAAGVPPTSRVQACAVANAISFIVCVVGVLIYDSR
eukprot:TRINITY_DN64643_c0_g2_i1.p1 TRINITY_DN64643_c0_g2~~TRINITY_DN64643_c0_g2_i1.p1  ORF type:complete len:145 (-),score=4.67 TRINITY_DN64643_c0_g2_i1:177-611(-)